MIKFAAHASKGLNFSQLTVETSNQRKKSEKKKPASLQKKVQFLNYKKYITLKLFENQEQIMIDIFLIKWT